MARKKTNGEFNFEETAKRFLEEAEKKGLLDNLNFKVQFKELCRMNKLCDDMYHDLEGEDLTTAAFSREGKETIKSNPLIKDYTTAHKTLITTSNSIQKMLDNIKVVVEDDEYFM